MQSRVLVKSSGHCFELAHLVSAFQNLCPMTNRNVLALFEERVGLAKCRNGVVKSYCSETWNGPPQLAAARAHPDVSTGISRNPAGHAVCQSAHRR